MWHTLIIVALGALVLYLWSRLSLVDYRMQQYRHLVDGAYSIFQYCTISYGACCCGDSMKDHTSPMDCGHTPVDMGAQMTSIWVENYWRVHNLEMRRAELENQD